MVVKVQYDALTRTFRLIDQEFDTLLEADALYDLAIPLALDEAGILQYVLETGVPVAHA